MEKKVKEAINKCIFFVADTLVSEKNMSAEGGGSIANFSIYNFGYNDQYMFIPGKTGGGSIFTSTCITPTLSKCI